MKKVSEFFQVVGLMGLFILYPVISVIHFFLCRKNGQYGDGKKFVLYGILGITGIAGIVATSLILPIPLNGLGTLIFGIPYMIGSKLQMDLIMKRFMSKKRWQ